MKKFLLLMLVISLTTIIVKSQIQCDVGVIIKDENSNAHSLKYMNPDFSNIFQSPPYLTNIKKITAGDFNGDGRDDSAFLLTMNECDNLIIIRKSNGSEIEQTFCAFYFTDPTNSTNNNVNDIDAGDFNGDGYSDLAINFDGIDAPGQYNCIGIYLSDGVSLNY